MKMRRLLHSLRREFGTPTDRRATRGFRNAILNEGIRARQVRLILGDENVILSKTAALARAKVEGMDLVAVAAESDPVVCKLMNYSREVYKKRIAAKEASQRQRRRKAIGPMKEIKVKGLIEDHDLGIKCVKIIESLSKQHSVKVLVTSNFRMLRQKSNCLEEVPSRLLAMLDEKETRHRVARQDATQSRLEMVLIPEWTAV